MNEQFISDNFCDAEISQMLNEVGFNEPCIGKYHLTNEGFGMSGIRSGTFKNSDSTLWIAAALYQQVTEWLFEARGISVSINSHKSDSINDFYSFVIHNQCLDMEHPDRCKVSKNSFNTQAEAYKAGILEAIAILKQQNT